VTQPPTRKKNSPDSSPRSKDSPHRKKLTKQNISRSYVALNDLVKGDLIVEVAERSSIDDEHLRPRRNSDAVFSAKETVETEQAPLSFREIRREKKKEREAAQASGEEETSPRPRSKSKTNLTSPPKLPKVDNTSPRGNRKHSKSLSVQTRAPKGDRERPKKISITSRKEKKNYNFCRSFSSNKPITN